ncbi:hypothetical protein ACFLW5_01915 [Chloroflexota bacterium]
MDLYHNPDIGYKLISLQQLLGSIFSLSSLVPQKADLLIEVQIDKILNDEDFAHIYEQIAVKNPDMPQTISDALDQMQQEIIVNPRDFHEALIFSHTSELTDFMDSFSYHDLPYYGALFKGSFGKTRALLTVGGDLVDRFQHYDYMGIRVYEYREGQDVIFSFAFFNNEVAVTGSTSAVKDTIDVIRGEKQSISGIIYDFYEGLGGNLIEIAYLVPGAQMEQIPPAAYIDNYKISLHSLKAINIIGFAFSKIGSSITTGLYAYHSSQAATRDTNILLNNLTLIYLSKEEALDPETRYLLDKIDIYDSDSVLSVEIIAQ